MLLWTKFPSLHFLLKDCIICDDFQILTCKLFQGQVFLVEVNARFLHNLRRDSLIENEIVSGECVVDMSKYATKIFETIAGQLVADTPML